MKEKIKTAALASASAMKANMKKGVASQKTKTYVNMQQVEDIISDWGSFPRKAAKDTIKKYGPPQEAIPSQLIWYNNGPWKRTRVIRDEIPHHFPQPHTDVLENVIDYKVPPHKVEDLARFDGSVYIDRTRGEVSSRCDMEAANLISLNLMHDIVTDRKTVLEARRTHGEITLAYLMDKPAPYAERLQFQTHGKTRFKDEVKIKHAMLHQGREKFRNELWRGNRKFAFVPLIGFAVLIGLILGSRRRGV